MTAGLLVTSQRALAETPKPLRISEFVTAHADDTNPVLHRAAEEAVARNTPLYIDQPVTFQLRWTPPKGLVLRGDGSERSRLDWKGQGDAVEVTQPFDIDGITIDGGLDPRSDRSVGSFGCLFSIHGPMKGSPAYLSGIRIGHLRVRRTRSVGIVLANIENLTAGQIFVEDIFCNGLILSGLRNCDITQVTASNIGDLKGTGHRRGSAVAIFSETKPVASWYDTQRILPTDHLHIGHAEIAKTTDSAFYIHDDLQTGVHDVTIDSVHVDTAGKDGFKTRAGPRTVRVGTVTVERSSLRGVDIESDDVKIEQIDVSHIGFDAVGAILGHPAPFSGRDATNESIQTHPNGLVIMGCSDVEIQRMKIADVASNPVTGAEGHGVHISRAHRFKVKGDVIRCDGNGLRLSGSSDFDIELDITDPCRGRLTQQAILLTPDKAGPNYDGTIRSQITHTSMNPPRFALDIDDSCGINATIKIRPDNPSDGSMVIRDNSRKTCGAYSNDIKRR
ncbi:hypothetical protein Bind_3918 (plasmid) [Beijerinckia indica subsp. indica ATCC 9039]|uniref:Right handed beta helix domain-containing protein n=2 Tax=Beijerinckia TaxID=532 RepID=B2ILP3_BEII9|nr:hypothetical protein Bind_3918 [Beijerinckia indica subsp. indica ATCC 9039]